MEAINRVLISKDWITLLLLMIVFLIVLSHFIDQKRLQQLLSLPYNKAYRLYYSYQPFHIFNILFFIISLLIISLFLYLIADYTNSDYLIFVTHPYLKILGLVLVFFSLTHFAGKWIAFLFNITEFYKKVVFIKMSYLYSGSIYLLILSIFYIYFFDMQGVFMRLILLVYGVLLLIRYIHFIGSFRKQISTHLFYYILYLCALEIAPLLIAVKIGI
jgi:hypothetical protein